MRICRSDYTYTCLMNAVFFIYNAQEKCNHVLMTLTNKLSSLNTKGNCDALVTIFLLIKII